jgi:hypothetical protein
VAAAHTEAGIEEPAIGGRPERARWHSEIIKGSFLHLKLRRDSLTQGKGGEYPFEVAAFP